MDADARKGRMRMNVMYEWVNEWCGALLLTHKLPLVGYTTVQRQQNVLWFDELHTFTGLSAPSCCLALELCVWQHVQEPPTVRAKTVGPFRCFFCLLCCSFSLFFVRHVPPPPQAISVFAFFAFSCAGHYKDMGWGGEINKYTQRGETRFGKTIIKKKHKYTTTCTEWKY